MKKLIRTLTFLSLAILPIFALAQMDPAKTTDYNNIKMPESPTSASLGKVDDLTVNTATGVPSISIPLYTFEIDGVSVPISISYNASGIKVGDLATSVGLNWSLEAGGQMSRTVRGKADDFQGWFDEDFTFLSDTFFTDYDPNDPFVWQRNMVGHEAGNVPSLAKWHDHNPDIYSYSFPGYSGSFIHKNNSNTDVIMEKNDGLEISDWTQAKDLYGNNYYFGITEKSSNTNIYGTNGDYDSFDWEGTDGFFPITAWKLDRITTKNGKEILFEYQDTGNFTYTIDTVENNITLGYPCDPDNPRIRSKSKTKTVYSFNTQLIDRISSPDGNIEVTFTYTTDTNLPEGVWPTQLDEITIIDRTDIQNPKKRGFRFVCDRYDGDPRLKLDALYEVWYINNTQQVVEKPRYIFSYKTGNLPSKGSKGQDFFGYNNNATGNASLVPHITGLDPFLQAYMNTNSGNRSLNTNYVDVGILTGIQYPTGGKTLLTYEPNKGSSNETYVGGLRIKEILKMDRTDTISQQTYEYAELKGWSMENNRQFTMKQLGGPGTHIYYSSFTAAPGSIISGYMTGYFYGKVIITTFDPDPSNNASYKEEHIYEQNVTAVHKFDYALKEKKYYKYGSVNPIKIEEYTNAIVGNPTYYEWNVLGDMMCFQTSNYTQPVLGHNNTPIDVYYTGDYAFLPINITTTEFLKQGTGSSPVTTVKDITYDPETLLKTQEITDLDGEVLTTDYKYPFIPTNEGFPADFPKGLLIRKQVASSKSEEPMIFGQAMEYDTNGNIKKTYEYNKGEVGNTSTLNYVDDYEQMESFIFSNGKPVQVTPKSGEPISYIWGFKNQYPMAKIEGKAYASITAHVTAIQNICNTVPYNETNLINALTNLRNAYPTAMVTTFTHYPLYGVKTITDPKGDTITYHYDTLGRLQYVTDKDGNWLTENEYNYRPQ